MKSYLHNYIVFIKNSYIHLRIHFEYLKNRIIIPQVNLEVNLSENFRVRWKQTKYNRVNISIDMAQ